MEKLIAKALNQGNKINLRSENMKEVYIYSKKDMQQKLRGEAIGILIGLVGMTISFIILL